MVLSVAHINTGLKLNPHYLQYIYPYISPIVIVFDEIVSEVDSTCPHLVIYSLYTCT